MNGIPSIDTPAGRVAPGTKIRITAVDASTQMFPDGIDHQALDLVGKSGEVLFIDSSGALHGSWGSLTVLPDKDSFEILS